VLFIVLCCVTRFDFAAVRNDKFCQGKKYLKEEKNKIKEYGMRPGSIPCRSARATERSPATPRMEKDKDKEKHCLLYQVVEFFIVTAPLATVSIFYQSDDSCRTKQV